MFPPFDRDPLERGNVVSERYVLDSPLGRGSMAEVWRAWDEQAERWVAIKIVTELLAPSERARQRFAREVEAIGRIESPHVVRLLDHGTLEDRPFLVMEEVVGETLASYLEANPKVSADVALELARQLLRGLAAAHEQGIIHRDLKPANILLAPNPAQPSTLGVLKIVDFGVARIIDIAGEEDELRLTAAGTMLGSPRYMPLEVARGAPDVDGRADIFALGAVVYHALTGHPPFGKGPIGKVVRAIIDHDFPELSAERPDLAADFCAVFDRALGHAPADRWDSAEEMQQALAGLEPELEPALGGLEPADTIEQEDFD